jgi:hypothetical protein
VTQTQQNQVFAFFKELCSSKRGDDQSACADSKREQKRTQKRFNERRILRMEDKSESEVRKPVKLLPSSLLFLAGQFKMAASGLTRCHAWLRSFPQLEESSSKISSSEENSSTWSFEQPVQLIVVLSQQGHAEICCV